VRTVRLLFVSLALTLLTTPAAAQESDLVDALIEAMNAMVAEAGGPGLEWARVPEATSISDPTGDLFTLGAGTPSFAPGWTDLTASSAFEWESARRLLRDAGFLDCERSEVACPTYETETAPFGGGIVTVGLQLAEALAPGGTEVFTGAVLGLDDRIPAAEDPRPNSPYAGTNLAWRVDVDAQGGQVRFFQVVGGVYQEFHTDARVLIDGNHVFFLVPSGEFANVVGYRAHTFGVPGENAAPEEQVADVDGPADAPLLTEPGGATGELRLSPPPEEPSPSPSPSPSPAESPTTSPSPRRTFDPGVGEVAEEGDDLWGWLLVAIGIAALLGGGLLFFGWPPGTRERGKPGPPHGPTRERGKPPPAPEEPAPAGGVPPPTEYAACDWAVYYRTDAGRTLLRPARGRECCVYTVSVFLTVEERELAARGRQEGVTAGAPNARLRMPHLVLEPHGLGAHVETGVRSGPAEDLAWMQGLGEPRLPDEVDPYRQLRSHQEPPEVAAHAAWVVANVVKVDLESMCPGHVNRYSGHVSGHIAMNADVECTYQGPPECPVEFTAAGWVQGKAGIFVDYDLTHQLGSDPDELEPVAPEGTPFHGITDLHDHERRDRLHYEASEVANDEANLQDDSLWLTFESGLVADAGTIVPPSIWPATGRVTALVGSSVEHGATIDAEMTRVDCVTGPCCGFSACTCAPRLQLRFGGDFGVIEVDGTSHRITPAPGPVGAGRAWKLG
jgi:hypothetical protein